LIKDSLTLYSDFKVLQTICKCCQAYDHDIEHCPLLTIQLDRQQVINRHIFSRSQDRLLYKRKFKKRVNSLYNCKEIESKALKIEIPANFSSSYEKSENNSEDNLPFQLKTPSMNAKDIPKTDNPIIKESSVKCYDTVEDLGIPVYSGSSRKASYLGDSKSRIEKKEDSWRSIDVEPLNSKFCSLEILLEEKNRRKLYEPSKGSSDDLNPSFIKAIIEEEKDDTGTAKTPSKSFVNKKKSVFNKASNEEVNKKGSYGSFSMDSLQNLNIFKEDHFFQTDEILGGTTKTTYATIQEFLLKNFEILGNYKIYFPHNNFENVLKWCRILQKGRKTIYKSGKMGKF